jgi:hypothetical protein
MNEEFWLKYGFKDNGEMTCVRILANSKPDEAFFYTDNEVCKPVKNSGVIKLTQEIIEKINGGKIK